MEIGKIHSKNNFNYHTKYLNLWTNAFSPVIAEAKKSISDEPSSIANFSKRDCFTHLANIVEAACKHCFKPNDKIDPDHVKMAIEAAIRAVLCYKVDKSLTKFIDKLGKEDPIYHFYQYLVSAYEEPTSENFLKEISDHKKGATKAISNLFHYDLGYTNTVKTLIKLGKSWQEFLMTDSDSNWLYNWFIERKSTGYKDVAQEVKNAKKRKYIRTVEKVLESKASIAQKTIVQNAFEIFKTEGFKDSHDYETSQKLELLKAYHDQNGNKLIVSEDQKTGHVYNKNKDLIYVESYAFGEIVDVEFFNEDKIEENSSNRNSSNRFEKKVLKIVEISQVIMEPFHKE